MRFSVRNFLLFLATFINGFTRAKCCQKWPLIDHWEKILVRLEFFVINNKNFFLFASKKKNSSDFESILFLE